MRVLAVTLAALLLIGAVPSAEGKRGKQLRGKVTAVRGKAPKAWRLPATAPLPTATPVASATATASPTPGATATATATPGSSLPPPNPRSVSVGSTEFAFTLSRTTVSAGQVRVQFDNSRAEDPHQLAVDGPDLDEWRFAEVESGAVVAYTLTMRPGRHVLFCPIPGHEELGMRAALTVE